MRPLIRQVVLKKPPIVISQRWSGVRLTRRVHSGQRAQAAGDAGPVGDAPGADPELHQGAAVGVGALGVAAGMALAAAQLDGLPRHRGEVDDHLDPLGRPEQDLAAADRLGHQPAVGGDLDQRGAVGELQVVAAKAGDVEDPQPVAARLDPVVGHVGAVDEDGLAEDAVGRRALAGEGVDQLVAAVEGAIADHQRQVPLSARQRQRGVEVVVDDEHPGQAPPAVAGGAVEAVVVVPLEGGALGPAVLDQVVDVGFPRPGLEQEIVARFTRREAVGDVAVVGDGLRSWSARPGSRRTGGGCGRRGGESRARRPSPGAGGRR